MKFVSENVLDRIVERFDDSDAEYEKAVEAFQKAQPVLFSYLFSEDFDVFTAEEREYMLLLSTIMHQAIVSENGEQPPINEKQLGEAEEKNWEVMQGITVKKFEERLDSFFQNYPQEDLLAFVEDALADDEEDPIVTKEAREAMFITLKTVVDCMVLEKV